MADNPIKHSDIIQEGDPFTKAIKGLKEMINLTVKLRKESKESAKTIQDFAKKQDTTSKKGRENIKKAATATQKLSDQDRELLRVQKALDKELVKANLLRTGS